MKSLKKLRESKDLTQVEAAKAIGVSVEAYRRWENGGGKASSKNLEKLKAVFGIKD